MTKPLSNDISVRGFGRCFSKTRYRFQTDRGTVFEGDLVLRFDTKHKCYQVWWRGPRSAFKTLQGGRVHTVVDRHVSNDFVGFVRSREDAYARLCTHHSWMGARPAE